MTGRRIGPWTIAELLGKGGNAEVFRASDHGGREVALKLIQARRTTAEPYQRFVSEIEFLRSRGLTEGLLPLIDSHLPVAPNQDDRPWLAMPIATPIQQALTDSSVPEVVSAIAAIAATLAQLHQDGIAHRDIKPGNLYAYNDGWVVGDFGLVAIPDRAELTTSGRPLGPLHYMPYEMLQSPMTADGTKADVYSLAKTLWVLASGQRWPVEGHQAAGTRGFSIGDFRYHPRAHSLDLLVDRATHIHPDARPTMAEVSSELHTWLTLTSEGPVIDLSAARDILRAKLEHRWTDEDEAERRREYALSAIRELQEAFRPLNEALLALHPRAQVDGPPDKYTASVLRTSDTFGSPEIVLRVQRLSQATSGDRHSPLALRMGRSVELTSDGMLLLRIFIDVRHPLVTGPDYFDWSPEPWRAVAGSAGWQQAVDDAVRQAAARLSEAALAFADATQT